MGVCECVCECVCVGACERERERFGNEDPRNPRTSLYFFVIRKNTCVYVYLYLLCFVLFVLV